MDSDNADRDTGTSRPTKRGTKNKRWKSEYTSFLIPVLVEQVNKGLKCDKTFKRSAFACAAAAVNARFNETYSTENVENHYRTLKARYVEIKKARELSGAGWNDEIKMIILDPIVCKTYTDAHPAAKPYINKPIENYEGLRIICGDDHATGSYATSMFSDFAAGLENDDMNVQDAHTMPIDNSEEEEDGNNTPPVVGTTSNWNTMRTKRTKRTSNSEIQGMMPDLISTVKDVADAIKHPTPTSEYLHKRVMEVEGYDKLTLDAVFDYLDEHEKEGRRFMVKDMDMRQLWIRRYLDRID